MNGLFGFNYPPRTKYLSQGNIETIVGHERQVRVQEY